MLYLEELDHVTTPPPLKTEASFLLSFGFGFGFLLELSPRNFSPTMLGPHPADGAEIMLNRVEQDFGNVSPV